MPFHDLLTVYSEFSRLAKLSDSACERVFSRVIAAAIFFGRIVDKRVISDADRKWCTLFFSAMPLRVRNYFRRTESVTEIYASFEVGPP